MPNKELPTAAHIRYMLVMKKLDKGFGIRSIDVAEKLGFSKPSVHSMMKVLSGMNYIKKENHGLIYFTELGYKMAEIYERCYEAVAAKFGEGINDRNSFESAIYAFLGGLSHQDLIAFAG